MARRSQCSSAGDNPLDPNYLPPHYREEYRLAIDSLVEEDLEGYYQFLQKADVVDFLSSSEIQYIQESVQAPQQSNLPDQRYVEAGGDGSSDTYWPLHSDLDAPGLDLGWPQLHHFIGPTEVTTLVNPPEPDMPSIKEQARRLIKNAQQVIAIAMDVFTDVDILHDILTAAMRNVAVYVLLDEQNAHHFVNMVANCRVNLESIQYLRVRTVSGITYHCRSGKSFKGQMMDRFLLTDSRAVLSGSYSFMWSFEKLHRCMAHLFLGQLVSTFDEEFRILFAQSQPLMIENMLARMEDLSLLQKNQYPTDITSLHREPRKFQPTDNLHPEEWARHSFDERMDVDWRMKPHKRKETLHGPPDIYGRFPSQQACLDPSFDQGHFRMPMMENPTFKRHSYAEGAHGRYSYPFLPQQVMPEPENQGRPFQWRQLPLPGPGKEADSSARDKFWNQEYQLADQYSEPMLPQEMEPDSFDLVRNYLSSTRNVDFDQSSANTPPEDLPFTSPQPRRMSLGQPYACQKSPTPPMSTDQKQFFPETRPDRKDPIVKQGLRDWRISSYLSTYDGKEDEGLPLAPPNAPDLFEEPFNPIQQTPGIDLSVPKIPNVREFKIPAIPRASKIPGYAKITAREQSKKSPDESTAVVAETQITPTPSESSSTTEEKAEEVEQKELKTAAFHREESFRRKYSPALTRSSRLRSSLIFSSLEQQHSSEDTKTPSSQQDVESDRNEAEPTKQLFVSQLLGQRRSTTKEPIEWSRYMKSATFDNSTDSATDSSKPDDKNRKADDEDSSKNPKDLSEKVEVKESLKPPDEDQAHSSPSIAQSKPSQPKASEAELIKTDQPKQTPNPLPHSPFYDMSDADARLMFFKKLAAERKAAQGGEAEKSKEKVSGKTPNELKSNTTVKKEELRAEEIAKNMADTKMSEGLSENKSTAEDTVKDKSTKVCKSGSLSSETTDMVKEDDSPVNKGSKTDSKEAQTRNSTDSEMAQVKNVQHLPVSAETEAPQCEQPEEPKLTNPPVEKSSPSHPPAPNSTPATVPTQGTDKGLNPDSTSNAALESTTQTPESIQTEINSSSPPLLPEPHTGPEYSSSNPESSSSDQIVPDSKISPSPSPCSSIPLPTPEDSTSTLASSILPENTQETPQLVEETSLKSAASSVNQIKTESSQAQLESVSQLTSSEVPSVVDSAHVELDTCPDTSAAGSEPNTSSLESFTESKTEEACAPMPSKKDVQKAENNSASHVGEESEVPGSSKGVKAEHTPPTLNPSLPESCSDNVADLQIKSRSEQIEIIIPSLLPADPLTERSPAETSSHVHPDSTETTTSLQDAPIHVNPPSKLNLTQPVTPSPAETVSCSSTPTNSVGSVLSPEAEKMSSLPSTSIMKSLSEQVATDSNETPELLSTETCCSSEPTPNDPAMPDLQCKPSDESDDNKDKNNVKEITTQELACSEKTDDQVRQNNSSQLPGSTSDEVTPLQNNSVLPQNTSAEVTPLQINSDLPESTSDEVVLKQNKSQLQERTSDGVAPLQNKSELPKSTSDEVIPIENNSSKLPESTSDEVIPIENNSSKLPESTSAEVTPLQINSELPESTSDEVIPIENNSSKLPESTSDEVVPHSPQSKQPKSSHSRYHSSTANVLSSSNLRDDTKLLLEQISANSQSRNEAAKESPVTDDEKEDEADKNAKREKERGLRLFSRGQPKTEQERDKLLEKIQSMRKERKVYSRFEMAP